MEQSARFFHGFADVFDTFYDGKRSTVMQWIDRRFRSDMFIRYEMTFQRLGDLTNKRGVDIGCGSGPFIVEALQLGAANMVAMDPAERMLELTRQRVEKISQCDRVQFLNGSFPDVIPDETFDFAIVMGVMDYVPDATQFLTALRRCVTDIAVVSFPSKHWFRTPLRRFRYRMRRCPVYFYDENEIHSLCTKAGFNTINIAKIPGAGLDYHACLRP